MTTEDGLGSAVELRFTAVVEDRLAVTEPVGGAPDAGVVIEARFVGWESAMTGRNLFPAGAKRRVHVQT
jgi:hypothetical protein